MEVWKRSPERTGAPLRPSATDPRLQNTRFLLGILLCSLDGEESQFQGIIVRPPATHGSVFSPLRQLLNRSARKRCVRQVTGPRGGQAGRRRGCLSSREEWERETLPVAPSASGPLLPRGGGVCALEERRAVEGSAGAPTGARRALPHARFGVERGVGVRSRVGGRPPVSASAPTAAVSFAPASSVLNRPEGREWREGDGSLPL